jgi:hypothetical protein
MNQPDAERHLDSYERAVTAMLERPPEDPLNWYRHALVHTLDCPHGNWWFLPWHRGYLGWLEKICRELSGDRDFALPYWDWTANPRMPERFLRGNLNPANFPITSFADFKGRFKGSFSDYWSQLTPDQLVQLRLRSFPSEDFVWAAIQNVPGDSFDSSMFAEISYVRELTPPRSQLFDQMTSAAVSLPTVKSALYATTFESFGSAKRGHHHVDPTSGAQGTLESQPHNMVHNNVGGLLAGPPDREGFMSEFLSPVDPIFFLHHSNIDRLWDVWTRKQTASGKSTEPADPADLQAWLKEPFLFFVEEDGRPTRRQTAGDYISTSSFDYQYQPGSGEDVVRTGTPTARAAFARQTISTILLPETTAARNQRGATFRTDEATTVRSLVASGAALVARITADFPPNSGRLQVHAFVNPPRDARTIGFADPGYAGTYRAFGGHRGHAQRSHELTFSIALTGALQRLAEKNMLADGEPIRLSVVADWPGVVTLEAAEFKVKRVEVVAS